MAERQDRPRGTKRVSRGGTRIPVRVVTALGISWLAALGLMFQANTQSATLIHRGMMQQRATTLSQVILTTCFLDQGAGGTYSKAGVNPHGIEPDSPIQRTLNGKQGLGVQFHVASEIPGLSTRLPDAWESTALASFDKGKSEQWTLADNGRVFRYMVPLRVESRCLSCHTNGAYQPGALRGGVSISIAADNLQAFQNAELRQLGETYLVIWLFGLSGLLVGARQILREHAATEAAVKERYRLLFERRPWLTTKWAWMAPW